MEIPFLTNQIQFPSLNQVHPTGIVAFGGDLSLPRLQLAYKNGVFPWFEDGEIITWWSPNERMVLFFPELKVSKSMRSLFAKNAFTVTFNTCFKEVILNCQQVKRTDQNGTWITDDMVEAYCELHKAGWAKSVEVWQNDLLVGGLYGIDLGTIFCGESMFSTVSNASKFAFISLAKHLEAQNYKLLDCQVYNDHLASLGCREIDREEFLSYLK
ncbi:leucyl/phenylalanyl-tRNA--protein transferase [Flavobacterium agricola]|uniref:Leucyl/phenylalanyl-tRNA--protein transferase n=1 Tax=Flavobacterium agricola TaxID=2870839 RepID=A0ABY6M3Z3_9FLAO|nr:leucyl/phenylalanyl-tRNA--protein transferase [Flavobacterium agricola]